MSQSDFDLLIQRVKGRLSKLAPRFVQAQTSSRFFRALGRISLSLGQGGVLEYVRLAILSDLVRRDQIESWELPAISRQSADDVRLVLAELANPAYSLRTQNGISTNDKPAARVRPRYPRAVAPGRFRQAIPCLAGHRLRTRGLHPGVAQTKLDPIAPNYWRSG
jgi:hypothetical protein